ncbi:hypothetical protein CKQ90_30770 [Klebsiella pneumoniae]|nr:hypothetical protein CKQ90_30770 [Klebsiella pneumoniae]
MYPDALNAPRRRSPQTRQWLNNDDNAMKRKLSWMCAVAVGMCSWYPLASYAAPAAVANAAWIASFVPRRPERAAPTLSADPAMAQQ